MFIPHPTHSICGLWVETACSARPEYSTRAKACRRYSAHGKTGSLRDVNSWFGLCAPTTRHCTTGNRPPSAAGSGLRAPSARPIFYRGGYSATHRADIHDAIEPAVGQCHETAGHHARWGPALSECAELATGPGGQTAILSALVQRPHRGSGPCAQGYHCRYPGESLRRVRRSLGQRRHRVPQGRFRLPFSQHESRDNMLTPCCLVPYGTSFELLALLPGRALIKLPPASHRPGQ
jgi:hypothetical protein